MSSLSSLDTAINSEAICLKSRVADACSSSSSCSINKKFVSVLIDKDEDYITKRNATFDINDVHRFRNASTNVSSSMKNKSSVIVVNSKPTVHKSNNRRKFYKWSKCKRETDGSTIASVGANSPQRIASRFGLTSKKSAPGGNTVGMV